MPRNCYSLAEARRIALAAQGFDRPRPAGAVDAGHLRRTVERLGLLQLDFVNVLVPAHNLVPFSRLGPYDPAVFQRTVYGSGRFTEHWAHEASIVPMASRPLLEYRRKNFELSPRNALFQLDDPRRYLDEVLGIVREKGAVTSADMPFAPRPRRKPGDWQRSMGRVALEYHFGRGTLAVVDRLPNFQRVYDLAERAIPGPHLQSIDGDDGRRALLARAAGALGIATTRDLADYFRMPRRDAAPRLVELADAGTLREVSVAGWDDTTWLHRDARLPRRIDACALLSPFDPLVWFRPRAERLFDFHYRIEIYVPAHKRRWGYYVLPFLCGDRIAARVDLKAERGQRQLQVRAAHREAGQPAGKVAERLAGELRELATWLDLDSIRVARRGDLARRLAAAVAD